MNPIEEIQEGKHFSTFNEKEQENLIATNFGKLNDYIVDWEMECNFLTENVNYKTEELGLGELKYEVDNYNNVFAENSVIVSDILDTIKVLLEVEKENEEVISMLQKAKGNYQDALNIAEDTTFTIDFYNREVVIEEEILYDEVSRLTVDEIKERMVFLKKNLRSKKALAAIREIKFKNLYSDEFEAEDLDWVLETFLEEKKEDLDGFVKYIKGKVNEMLGDIKRTFDYIGSFEHIEYYLKETENIVFDEDGECVFI